MRRALTIVCVGMMVLAAACGGGGKGGSSQQGSVASQPPAPEPAPEATTTTVALTPASLMLAADGLGARLHFGTQAARALSGLDQALGKAAPPTPVAEPVACGATRIFRWADLAVVVNEVSGRSGAALGFVGWALGASAPAGTDLKTDKGIGIGSTVRSLRAAYGDTVVFAPGPHGPGFTITTTTGPMTGELDAQGDSGRIRALQAGTVC
ncbi:MAG TPA: hypothetical protein VGP90_03570 [Acidimicrobiia bacterium]|nr:hypothetical protein [Acidimicrobiia bacterium]